MIRFLFASGMVILYLIVTLPVLLIIWLLGLWKPKLRDRAARCMIKNIFRFILFGVGVKITVIGQERIPKEQAVLYVGNHRSFFDILLGYVLVPDITGFVAKKELEKFPVFNVWMRYIHCLFLDRENVKEGMKTILAGAEEIKNGVSIFIFPEGTRSSAEDEREMLAFHNGSFKMAAKAGCPIVPVAFLNTRNIFEAQFPKIKKTHVVVEFCEPILYASLSKEEQRNIGNYTRDLMIATLTKNKEYL